MWIPQCLKNALSGHCCLSVEDIEMTTFNNGAKSTDLLVTRIAVAGSCITSQQPSPALLAMSYDSMVPSAPVQPTIITVQRNGTAFTIPIDHPHLGYLPQLQLITLGGSTWHSKGKTAVARLTRNEHSFISRTLFAAISTDLKVKRLTNGILNDLKATIPVIDAHVESTSPLPTNWTDNILGYVTINWRQLTYHGMLKPQRRPRSETTTFFVINRDFELERPDIHVLLSKVYNTTLNIEDIQYLVSPRTVVTVKVEQREQLLFEGTVRGFRGLGAAAHFEPDYVHDSAPWDQGYGW